MNNHHFKYKKLRPSKMILFTLFVLFITINTFNIRFGVTQTHGNLRGANVAVYNGNGALESSYIALKDMFEWMGANVNSIDSDDILGGSLSNCDILAYPGGNTLLYQVYLGEVGLEIIRNFLRNGGSYFGICGGALFGTNGLDLIDGSFLSTNPELPSGTYIIEMNVNRGSTGPDLSNEPASYHLLYWSSQYYHSNDMSNINPIMTYSYNNQPGMITFRYGTGTVFLSSPHPEYEENSDRDGTSDFDILNDPDSEWGILLKISLWLYSASYTLPENFWISIIIAAAVVIAIIVFAIYQRRKR